MVSVIRVSVQKNPTETAASLIRRFTKRVQGSSVLSSVRARRYAERPESKYKRKARAIKRIARYTENNRLRKLGKLKEKTR